MTFDELNLSKQADGLLPVIVQDAVTLKVLMLGYMNREAFDRSMAEGRVTFFSRTRGCLWTKGETSGNYLAIESVYADCDGDTLLIKASPADPCAIEARRAVSTLPMPRALSAACKASCRSVTATCPRARTPPNCL